LKGIALAVAEPCAVLQIGRNRSFRQQFLAYCICGYGTLWNSKHWNGRV